MSKTSSMYNTFYKHLTAGVDNGQWGYGIHRVKLTADTKDTEFARQVPYTFITAGFKTKEGNWFTCMQMNVDKHTPQKMRPMNQYTDIHQLWGAMMAECAREYADNYKH